MSAAALAPPALGGLKFARSAGFHAALKEEVAAYFATTGRSPKGGRPLYLKTAAIAAWLGASYGLLVFAPLAWWQGILCAISLGLAIAGAGFNIQHDGNHGAFSRFGFLNRLAGLSIDLLGGSSYLWRYKHNVFHHTYTNLKGWDEDISIGILGRLSPHIKRRSFHRYQHIYLWPFYGLLAMKWQLYDDYKHLLLGTIGGKPFPRPRGWDFIVLMVAKAVSLSFAILIPSLSHPIWVVLLFYALTLGTAGIVLAVVFQLAHCVEEARHPAAPAPGQRTTSDWARHQVETSVDFARKGRLVTWYVGGLNMQIEHHLFPKVSHVHYPALTEIVEHVCGRFGVEHRSHDTVSAAVASHYRFLRRLGRADLLPTT